MTAPAGVRPTTLDDGAYHLVLPGTWARIPLEDPERSRAAIKALVRRQAGTADRLARVRRETATSLQKVTDDARAVGMHTLLLALELLPGVPLGASLGGLDVAWPDPVARAAWTAGGDLEPLAAAVGGEVLPATFGVPSVRVRTVEADTLGSTPTRTARSDYFVPRPGGERVLVLRATVPVATDPVLGEVFDLAVGTLSWGGDAAQPDGTAAEPDGTAAEPDGPVA